jgi:predicted RNase H-like HicB family nuclease
MTKKQKFTVILEPEQDGGYSVHCPVLPGCSSQGDTREEALINIVEAIEAVLEVMKENRQPLEPETPQVISKEIEEILKAREEDGLPPTVETIQVTLPEPVKVSG